MSHEIECYYRVYNETWRTARKAHACDACHETIEAGHRYCIIFLVQSEGETETLKRCLRCQKIHEHLRTLGENGGDTWPDEYLNCGQEYAEHWGHAPPEAIAALAFMTPTELQATVPPARCTAYPDDPPSRRP